MLACQNCGANVKFDIASQQMRCEYCNSLFDPYSYDSKESDGIETKDFDATIFTCPQCGGEILSTDDTAAGFCSFCGASTVLYSRIQKENRPNYIIPFKKTKDDCKQAYSELMKKAIFAPNELKDPKHIDSFRGIYMPYWTYYITHKGPFDFKGKTERRSGDYIITDHYDLRGEVDAYYKGLSYDASSSFADNISETLAPYDVKGMKAFTPAYLSGFYADTADVPSDLYKSEAESIAHTQTQSKILSSPAFNKYSPENGLVNGPHGYSTKFEAIDYSMFPVWFMSFRNGDRVAYAAVNGQTGKVVVDLPVDKKKYLLGSLILALPIFILLCLLFTPTPATVLTVTGILSLITMVIYSTQLGQISKKESNLDDRGMAYKKDPNSINDTPGQTLAKNILNNTDMPAKKVVNSTGRNIVWIVFGVYFLIMFGSAIFSSLSSGASGNFVNVIIWLIISIATIVFAIIGFVRSAKLDIKTGLVGLILTIVTLAFSVGVALMNPVYDMWYYGASILLAISELVVLTNIITAYNRLSTRELPQFNHKGGDDRA